MSELPVVQCGSAMPVCLHGNRLTFISRCQVFASVMGTIQMTSVEEAGSSWDGATIPRLFWRIIGRPLSQEFRWASFWHDRLCERSYRWSDRRAADAVLLALLDREGVAYWRRTAMWLAVRLYAWTVWSWRRQR